MEDKVCSKICTMLWLWWFERNKAHSGERIRGCNEIQASIEIHCRELRRNGIKRKKLPKLPCSDKWKPPPPNVLKINTDGAYVENSHKGGWGYVLRNDKGEVLAAGAGSMQHISEAIHAESLALLIFMQKNDT